MRVVFWQNIPSVHQSPLIRALSEREDFQVIWVVESGQTRSYWRLPDTGRAALVQEPSQQEVLDLVTENESNSLHVFSMHHHPRGLPLIHTAFTTCLRTRARMAFLGEGTIGSGPRTVLRMMLEMYYRFRWPDRIGFILCQGFCAETWFRRCGYSPEIMFPFGFFVDDVDTHSLPESDRNDSFMMTFIGSLIRLNKGLDLLLKTLKGLKNFPWRLRIIGDGDKRPELESMCKSLGLSDRVVFMGNLANESARCLLADSDLLVLPSRNDSWGAVVNEALLAGCPVVCSDICGSKVLLSDPERGGVFRTDSHDDLRRALVQRFEMGKTSRETSARIKEWSKRIRGEAVADYVVRIINWAYFNGPRPAPPWEDE